MNALRLVWRDTRMVVLVALSAALYAAILIPFKIFTIIPGTTEIRPANAIPMVTSLLFGPAGAWGSAIGNLVGDFFGGLGPGNIFGFIGNFLYGYIPYVLWRTFFGETQPAKGSTLHWLALMFIFLVAGCACAFMVALGIDVVIGGVPFAILGALILINNFMMSALLAPALLFALQPRVRAWSLHWTQILPPAALGRPRFAWLGVILITVGSLGGMTGGMAVATGLYRQQMGFDRWWSALKRVAVPGTEAPAAAVAASPAPGGGTSAPADAPAVRRGHPAATSTTTLNGSGSAVPGTAAPGTLPPPGTPGAHRMGLGLAMLPAVILILVGAALL